MANHFFADHDAESPDTDRPVWPEVSGIVLILAAVLIGMAIAGTFSPF